jgi:hypothetical protein
VKPTTSRGCIITAVQISRRKSRREMKLLKGIGTGLCVTVLCLVATPKAKAGEQDSKTVVNFAVPVEVPGVGAQTLPAGTYLFKALDSSPDRDIIQISNQDGTHVFATFLGVPNSRLKAPDLITVMFSNRPAADPQALKAWFYPGRMWGDQIVYEKTRATQLAKETNESVLSTSGVLATSSVDVLKSATIEAVNPGGGTVALAQVVDAPPVAAPALAVAAEPAISAVPVVAATPMAAAGPAIAVASPPATETMVATADPLPPAPIAVTGPPSTPASTVTAEPTAAPAPIAAPEPVAVTEPPTAVQPAVSTSPAVAVESLPKTASLLPLIGLVGLLLLGAGFLLSNLLKRRA